MGIVAWLNTFYWQISATLFTLLSKVMGVFSSQKPIDMSSPKVDMVKELINTDTVVIFSKTYCPYCKVAKEVFNNMKKTFTTIELDQRDDGDEIQGILGEITGAKTVLNIKTAKNISNLVILGP